MNQHLVDYIDGLAKSKGISQSQLAREIFVSRQQISYVFSGARDLTLDLAIRLETFFGLPDGRLLEIQNRDRIMSRKKEMRSNLVDKLSAANAFWSYGKVDPDLISDDDIIEATIVHLDMQEIEQLFVLFGKTRVKSVWKSRLLCQGEHMRDLNIMVAMYYFGIMHPEDYIARSEREYFKKLESET